MSLLSGHMPHLPPPPRSEPHGNVAPEYAGDEPLRPREKDWTGCVGTGGALIARRPADSDPHRGRRWWFECLLCGRWVRREPWRVFSRRNASPECGTRGLVRTCGCGPKGSGAAEKRAAALGVAA